MFYSQIKQKQTGESYIYYRPDCKECTIKQSDKWNKDNKRRFLQIIKKSNNSPKQKERIRISGERRRKEGKVKEWQRKNPDKLRGYNLKRKEKDHNISDNEWQLCKEYFNHKCSYCGITEVEHKKIYKQQLHKEHLIPEGRNDIKNCVPSCKSCNASKGEYSFNNWYQGKEFYTRERYLRVYQWIRYEVHNVIEKKN